MVLATSRYTRRALLLSLYDACFGQRAIRSRETARFTSMGSVQFSTHSLRSPSMPNARLGHCGACKWVSTIPGERNWLRAMGTISALSNPSAAWSFRSSSDGPSCRWTNAIVPSGLTPRAAFGKISNCTRDLQCTSRPTNIRQPFGNLVDVSIDKAVSGLATAGFGGSTLASKRETIRAGSFFGHLTLAKEFSTEWFEQQSTTYSELDHENTLSAAHSVLEFLSSCYCHASYLRDRWREVKQTANCG